MNTIIKFFVAVILSCIAFIVLFMVYAFIHVLVTMP